LDPGANLLSPRGAVLENGMPRFFRRLAPGVFDEADLRVRTADLADFVAEAARLYHFNPRRVFAAGFSNGANIAASLLLLKPGVLEGAILFSPMVPFQPDPSLDLTGVPVFIGAAEDDPMVEPANTRSLAALLERAGADVTLSWKRGGHSLAPPDVEAARKWLHGR
jgi:phospholipase/carboxylesterase/glyoxalase family protein